MESDMRIFKTTYRDRDGQMRGSEKWYVEFRDAKYMMP